MTSLQNFDLQAAGLVAVAQVWKREQEASRSSIWSLSDLIEKYVTVFDIAANVRVELQQEVTLPRDHSALVHFAERLNAAIRSAQEVMANAESAPARKIQNLEILKQKIEQAQQILEVLEDIADSEQAKEEGPSRPFADFAQELDASG